MLLPKTKHYLPTVDDGIGKRGQRPEKGILASALTLSNTISTFSGTSFPRLSTIEKDTLVNLRIMKYFHAYTSCYKYLTFCVVKSTISGTNCLLCLSTDINK